MCVACPGAGKTFTMSQRAGHLVSVHAEGNLAAVSFTAAAAGELRERILRTVSCSPKRIGAGTFHSLAKHQLTQAGIKVKLASEMQTRQAIENLAATAGVDANDLISAIDLFKSDPYPSEPAAEYRAAIRDYQSWLDREGLMDFSDLLRRAVAGMADGSVAPMNVRWMLADEIQDADAMQWAWLFAHAKAGVELTCVGDEDQLGISRDASKDVISWTLKILLPCAWRSLRCRITSRERLRWVVFVNRSLTTDMADM